MSQAPVTFLPELQHATGRCPFSLSNDYIFRAVLQTNNLALKGLIGSLLHITPEQILSVEIVNPILLGDHFDAKEFRLDINVLLNNHTLINLEMQMVYQADWHERSLIYICRNLESLSHGEDYASLRPAIHIGILDKAPIHEENEFYSENMVMNVKTHKIYSDKLSLRVLRLDCIDNATAEDKAWKIDCWARLFKAATWEEIMTIAEHDKYLTSASNSLYLLNADEMARKRARDQEDYYRDLRNWKRQIEEQKATLEKQAASLAEQAVSLAEKDQENAALQNELSELRAKLAQYESQA